MKISQIYRMVSSARKTAHRRKGDRFRDARDWSRAANAYELHLNQNPTDQAIWVQLGHAWKEQNLLERAVRSYQTGVELDGLDMDAHIHFADVLRRLGRNELALTIYEQINATAPHTEATRQIRALRRATKLARPATAMGDGTIFFSIQDLFMYLYTHVTLTGIQRVQAGIAAHAIDDATVDARFILSEAAGQALPVGDFWMLDNQQLKCVITYASGSSVDHAILREMIASCEDAAEPVCPLQGSTIIILGAFWSSADGISAFIPSKRNGVRIGAYVYDIIPVTHPQFCVDAFITEFSMGICELCAIADFILTISDATQVAVEDFIAANGGRPMPMATVPLAHHLTQDAGKYASGPTQLEGRRYVAYVSTIEARKNHLYVVNAWRRLIVEGVDVPNLVFVGRMGWKIEALTKVLSSTDNLDGRLHVAHDLSDGELNAVYANCEFSVFTSFVEGWGLPIGESLFHGRPCVASNTSSMPEVGGDLVDYVDPFDLADGVDVLRRMITQPAYRRQRTQAIRERFVARTWADVGADFLKKTADFGTVPVTPFVAILAEGKMCSLASSRSDRVDVSQYFQTVDRLLVQADAFSGQDRQGIWMRGANAKISIATNMLPGTPVLAFLRLITSSSAKECRLRVVDCASGQETAQIQLGGTDPQTPFHIALEVGKHGSISLMFDIAESNTNSAAGNLREFAIGLQSVGYARADNIAARQELMEAMTMQDMVMAST